MLALALGGRSVAEWQGAISVGEFERWIEFYRLYPFDDLNRIHRPAALIAQNAAGKGDIQSRLDFLFPDKATEGLTDVDMSWLRAFGYTGRRPKTPAPGDDLG